MLIFDTMGLKEFVVREFHSVSIYNLQSDIELRGFIFDSEFTICDFFKIEELIGHDSFMVFTPGLETEKLADIFDSLTADLILESGLWINLKDKNYLENETESLTILAFKGIDSCMRLRLIAGI